MKVLLLNVPFYQYGGNKGHGGHLIPLNLCYLAAYSREKHKDIEVEILDAEVLNYSIEETIESCVVYAPDIIGITTTTSAFSTVIDVLEQLKRRMPDLKTVLGGPHVSALPEQSLRESKCDFIVIGEGEVTFSELIEAIKKQQSLTDVDGIAYVINDIYQQNDYRKLIEQLDILPFPARDLVDNMLYYPPPTKRVSGGPNTMISTSRGCPHNCGFCASRSVWQRKVRYRSAESVISEVKEAMEKYNISSINFTDEYFTMNKKRVIKICEMLIDEKIKISWVCSARAEKLDKETLKIMKKAGCQEISFGIESGSTEILKKIDKKLNLFEAKRVVKMTQKVGIRTHASYIIGYIGETERTIKKTIDYSKSLNTDIAAFFIASPLPGSRLYQEALKKGFIKENADWKEYSPLSNSKSVMTLPDLSIDSIRYWHRKALRSYYLRLSFILLKIIRIRHFYEIKNILAGIKIFLSIKK